MPVIAFKEQMSYYIPFDIAACFSEEEYF